MKKVFINRMSLRHTASIMGNHTQLCSLLGQAATQAARSGKATLVSLVLPGPEHDPLHVFRALSSLYPGTCSYWEQPARQVALVGAGTALNLESHSADHFAEVARIWREVRTAALVQVAFEETKDQHSALYQPALFGGFRFDPLRPQTALWQNFPAGKLTLPRLLFRQQEHQSALILSTLVQATDDLDNLADTLFQELIRFSETLTSLPELVEAEPGAEQEYRLRDIWPAESWKALVADTVQSIQKGFYEKVVLAREVEVTTENQERPFSLATTLQRLRLHYPAANVFALQRGERTFIGATPERLVHAHDGQLHTMALAGSAPRGTNEEEDRQLGSSLLNSPKNRAEHGFVTAMLRASLASLCSKTWIADTPELLRLKNIQHLQTAIVGELLPNRSILDALQTLHPTPAVGGTPTAASLAFIRAHEHLDRGWYAGPIGWIDFEGNGEFAVALRSALLEPHKATLFAGCGIVKDSVPEAEYAESCLKLQVILRSLSGEE